MSSLRLRWLGRVPYGEALDLQQAMFEHSPESHLLLLEHPHVFTMGVRAKPEHLLDRGTADVVHVNRGGDITYHGPGQLVGYPIMSIGGKGGLGDTRRYVHALEQLLIDVLEQFDITGSRDARNPGVWVDDRKIAAVGVRITRGRTMHGFALNVDTNMDWFGRIVPCGLRGVSATSMHAENSDATMQQVVDAVALRAIDFARAAGAGVTELDRQDIAWRVGQGDLAAFTRGEGPGELVKPESGTKKEPVRLLGRLAQAGVDMSESVAISERKPEWMRVKADFGPEYQRLKKTVRSLDLVTVCEEAGCPNIFDCWNDGTATFMINGERCTRACGFCLVDTRKPEPLDPTEPERVAEAIERMGLGHAVITVVARDDLTDGGAGAVAATVRAIHSRTPQTAVEVLISDCKGNRGAHESVFASRPEVLNHNIETVARLQRAVRPSAGYARSLTVLARARAAGLTTKSGLIVGMGETRAEVIATLADLRAVGVDIVTIGQYLRPTSNHLPVSRWWTPEEFTELKEIGEAMGIGHVEASPLTRSSYHAKQAAANSRAKVG